MDWYSVRGQCLIVMIMAIIAGIVISLYTSGIWASIVLG